jgi:uncharacterized protein with GYD domain
MLVVERDDPP